MVERIAHEVGIAALEPGVGQRLAYRSAQAGVIVGDDIFDTMQAAGFELDQKVRPRRTALAIGKLNGEDLATSFPVDAQRHKYGARANHTHLTDLARTWRR